MAKRTAKKKVAKKALAKRHAGRPTSFREEYIEQAYKLSVLGHTDLELAEFFEVAESTLHLWKKKVPGFSESINKGKVLADADVAVSLYERACGYSHPEDRVFCTQGEVTVVPITKHYPPDTNAASLWLRNRQSKRWRDKMEVDIPPDGTAAAFLANMVEHFNGKQSTLKPIEGEFEEV